ncbi:patatin-like phospholipase family protein [Robiginitalea sp. IMCC43444]|uniref:patatin-like phospholipase family protein n=1 Tax=Robiginitalea sp. IMCC43444 TaxID=3459121 RepID=UPI0040421E97
MRLLLIFALISVLTNTLPAQEQNPPEDLKVGLVLSGGGAKGLAHIGALKVIEEAGVRIDYIGGTSMGAIVGALYASGYSAHELDSLFRNTDFPELIQDNLPRSAKTFYEKEDSERYALTLPFNNYKLAIPQALSGGQNIYNELVKVLYHVKDVRKFDQLPIPFFCVATDVETGEEIILREGYLPEAILASGTFPSLFEPTEVDGRILIDGGVLNNYPVDEVKNSGAELIIGVDVQHGLRKRESLQSATEILLQINNYRTVGQMKEKAGKTDIYIKPNMDAFSVIDFNMRESIISIGEKKTREHLEALKEVAARQVVSPPMAAGIQSQDTIVINRLLIKGNNNYSRGYVKGKLRFDLAEKTSFNKLQQGLGNLSATGNFRTIRYELVSNGLGQDLILKLQENPNRTFIRVGAHYDDLYKSAALINLTRKHFLVNDDVASFDFILGDNLRYNAQYYIDKGSYWSFGVNSRLNEFDQEINYNIIRSNFDVPEDPNINNINLEVSDLTNQVYLQTVVREEFAFSLGVEHKLLKYSTETLSEVNEDLNPGIQGGSDNRTFFEKSNYFSTYGTLVLDTYNDRYFPSRGLYFNGDFHLYLFSSDFNDNFKEFSIAKARMGVAFPLAGNLSLNLETEGGFKLGTSGVSAFDFVLGGFGSTNINNFTPFIGYDFLSLPGNSYVKAYSRFDLEFAPKNHLMFTLNYANVEDDIFRTGEWFTTPDFSGYGLSYGWDSFFGPVQVMYSWSPERDASSVFFSIGYWF